MISNSTEVAKHLNVPSVVIPNSYKSSVFVRQDEVARIPGSLVFVGRLVHDKGVHILLEAMGALARKNVRPPLTVIGEGPERERLEADVDRLGLGGHVTFVGAQRGEELARTLNRHDVIVVPSLWAEPFGIVALEGIACGCVAIVSEQGGLPEAVGSAGVLVKNGDAGDLAEKILSLLDHPELVQQLRGLGAEHIRSFTEESMPKRYLEVLARSIAGRETSPSESAKD